MKNIGLWLLLVIILPLSALSQDVQLDYKLEFEDFTLMVPKELFWEHKEDNNSLLINSKIFEDFVIKVTFSKLESYEEDLRRTAEKCLKEYMRLKDASFAGKNKILEYENNGFATAILYEDAGDHFLEWIEFWLNKEKGIKVMLSVSGKDPERRVGIFNYATAIEKTLKWKTGALKQKSYLLQDSKEVYERCMNYHFGDPKLGYTVKSMIDLLVDTWEMANPDKKVQIISSPSRISR